MKLSDTTVGILKNFTTINGSILFREGNVLTTIHPQKQIAAMATVEDEFPKEVAIYDLSQFLGVLSLFDKNVELSFGERQVTVTSGNQRVFYTYAEPEMIKSAPAKIEIPFPPDAFEFDLPASLLKTLVNSLSVLGHSQVSITGDGTDVYIGSYSKDASASSYKTKVGESDHVFNVVISAENLRMIPKDYKVTVSKACTRFVSEGLVYWLVNSHDSKF